MKQYVHIFYTLVAIFLLAILFCACGTAQTSTNPSTESVITTLPNITIETQPNLTLNTSTTIQTTTPEDTHEQGPITSRPVNSFSPNSSEAGTAFLSERDLVSVTFPHGISQFLLLMNDNPTLPFNVACHITENCITAMLPDGIDLSKLTVKFKTESTIYLNGKELQSGDTINAKQTLYLTIITPTDTEQSISLDIQTLCTGLPSVALTVEDFHEIDSKDYYFPSTFYVGGGDPVICNYATNRTTYIEAEAKGRGNTSWSFEKKGFTIKLSEKKDLLGLGKSRNWTLISNYQDKSLMRNEVAAHISEMLGLPTMCTRSVDLWLNGSYWGTYLLIEKIELESERIDYPDYDEVDDPNDAGLILEWDGHVGEVSSDQKNTWIQLTEYTYYDPVANINFVRLDSSYIVIHQPNADNIVFEQIDRAETLIMQVHNALKSHNYALLEQYLDLESFAAWYLVEDIMKNMDAQLHSSCYMHVGSDGILHMGPVWDFDMSLGNANYGGINDPNGAYIATKRWFKYLFEMEEFCQLVNTMLTTYQDSLSTIPDYIDTYAAMLERSQAYNFERWDILDIKVGFNPQNIIEANTYQKQIDLMKNFYIERLSVVRKLVENACESFKQQKNSAK